MLYTSQYVDKTEILFLPVRKYPLLRDESPDSISNTVFGEQYAAHTTGYGGPPGQRGETGNIVSIYSYLLFYLHMYYTIYVIMYLLVSSLYNNI